MKKFYKQTTVPALLIAAFVLVGASSVQAQETNDDQVSMETIQQLQQLQQEVEKLQDSLSAQVNNQGQVEGIADIPEDSTINYDIETSTEVLQRGDRGESVQLLQEILAEDDSIYPEGLVTGYYGSLTAQAVSRLQERVGVEATGKISLDTVDNLSNFLEESANDSTDEDALEVLDTQEVQDIAASESNQIDREQIMESIDKLSLTDDLKLRLYSLMVSVLNE